MAGPLLPLLVPLGLALMLMALRRWPVAAGLTGCAASLLLAIWLAGISLEGVGDSGALFAGAEWTVFGRSLFLAEGARQILLLVYLGAAELFLLSSLWPQGPSFVPAGMAALSPISAMLMATPFSLGLGPLLLTSALVVVMIQSGRAGSTQAALRYLLMTVLALPFFFSASWIIESQQFVLLSGLWRLLLVGMAIVFAGFPFQIWVRPVVREAPALVSAFVFGLVQTAVIVYVYRLLVATPALWESTQLAALLRASGTAVVVLASLLAFHARSPKRLLGTVLVADMGALLLVVSTGPGGEATALALLVLRFVGLLLTAPFLHDGATPDAASRPARWLFSYGVASLAGMPLTPGFAGRWLVVGLAASVSPWLALPFVLAGLSSLVGIRSVLSHHDALDRAPAPGRSVAFLSGLKPVRVAAITLLFLGAILFTVYPNALLLLGQRVAIPY